MKFLELSMLRSSFIHIQGVGLKQEQLLWQEGILSWDDLVLHGQRVSDRQSEAGHLWSQKPSWYADSLLALKKGNLDYFMDRMPLSEHYRLALAFSEDVLFLDLETTGLNLDRNHITMVGWSLAGRYNVFVPGYDSQDLLRRDLSTAKALVTYNGKIFDLQFLAKEFKSLKIPDIHVDLRYFGQKVGFRGGQKNIEKKLGLFRPGRNGDGHEAVRRYGEYRSGNIQAMEELILYNRADVEGMKHIFDACVKRQMANGFLPNLPGLESTFAALADDSVIFFKEPKFSTIGRKISKIGLPRTSLDLDALENLSNLRQLTLIGLCPGENCPKGQAVAIISGHKSSCFFVSNQQEFSAFLSLVKPRLVAIGCPTEDLGANHSKSKSQDMNINLLKQLRNSGQASLLVSNGSVKEALGLEADERGTKLREVLSDFGLDGDYESYSEQALEALVAALAGYFFWSGKFHFGEWSQERLVLANLTQGTPLWRERTVIAFSGYPGVGKSTSADFLSAAYNFVSIPVNTLNLTGLKSDLLLKLDEYMGARRLVVDSLSKPEEVAIWRSFLGPAFINCHILRSANRIQNYSKELFLDNRPNLFLNYYCENTLTVADLTIDNSSKISNLKDLLSLIIENNWFKWA
jgi:uncharacterized protein YprB with RNaseH-like and TPR domain